MSAASTNTRPHRRTTASTATATPQKASFARPAARGGRYASRNDAPQRRAPAAGRRGAPPESAAKPSERPEPKILFQNYFKSVGPRTYAAQVKQAANGNHFLVLTEGKRDPKTGEVKKISLFVYSEDFAEYFRLIKSAAEFVKAHPVPEEVKQRQAAYWKRQRNAHPRD